MDAKHGIEPCSRAYETWPAPCNLAMIDRNVAKRRIATPGAGSHTYPHPTNRQPLPNRVTQAGGGKGVAHSADHCNLVEEFTVTRVGKRFRTRPNRVSGGLTFWLRLRLALDLPGYEQGVTVAELFLGGASCAGATHS